MTKSEIDNVFRNYVTEVNEILKTNDYTEMSFRTPFQNLIEKLNGSYKLVQEPGRKKKFGAPDFKAFNKSTAVGYIETKKPEEDLDGVLSSEQMKKYSENVGNLILTNYRIFILIRGGVNVLQLDLLSFNPRTSRYERNQSTNPDDLLRLLDTFFDYSIPRISSAKELAENLSKKAKLIRDIAEEILGYDIDRAENGGVEQSAIYEFYIGIKELIHEINKEKCADAYGQTITYGLFLSKIKNKNLKLQITSAAMQIPKSIPVIRKIFLNISNESFPASLSWIVNDIIDILNSSDIEEIINEFDRRGKTDRDPITFFYESFLGSYDKESQKHLGVYYTPRPVVNFIVNSVHMILKSVLGISYGLANDQVTLLDPATGTGTFMWMAFLVAIEELKQRRQKGSRDETIRDHLLKNFYGLEILIAPYIFSHLKLSSGLKSLGYDLSEEERVQVYYPNTLVIVVHEGSTLLPFLRELSNENRIANAIKGKKKILTIIGNPPYNRLSSNNSKWILEKMETYKNNLVENERNKQPLGDDYLKFFRFAQWKIEQNGSGILGFISNNSYLDGIIHREMRSQLYQMFDQVYIVNLHGDSRRGEKAPDGGKDENVFDIMQGVAIGIFVKTGNHKSRKFYGYLDKYGLRETKYQFLDRTNVFNVKWTELKPSSPYYYMRPISTDATYDSFTPLSSIFKQITAAVVPGLNAILVDLDRNSLSTRMRKILSNEDISVYKPILSNSAGNKILRNRFKAIFDDSKIVPFHFHPFDYRYIYYEPSIMERARKESTESLKGGNFGIVLSRVNARDEYNSVIVTRYYPYYKLAESSRGSYLIPFSITDKKNCKDSDTPCTNFKQDFLDSLSRKFRGGENIDEKDVMGYIYSILYSNKFRIKYKNELKQGFPRIPIVADTKLFDFLCAKGKSLIDLHCLDFEPSNNVSFDVPGSGMVSNPRYEEKSNSVYINDSQCFAGVTKETWEFDIGGYQVIKKWLNERSGTVLRTKDVGHFVAMCEAIDETLKIVKEVDAVFDP